MTKAIVLLSGGMESATALYWARAQGWEVRALSIDYAGRPKGERAAARRLAAAAGGVALVEVDLGFLRAVKGLREAGVLGPESRGCPDGYIPMRNLVFYAVAGHFAEVHGAEAVVGGHTGEDGEDFADATEAFFELVEAAYRQTLAGSCLRGGQRVRIVRPFARATKMDAAREGKRLGVPFHLTWSCWHDLPEPCGVCTSCQEREQVLRVISSAGD